MLWKLPLSALLFLSSTILYQHTNAQTVMYNGHRWPKGRVPYVFGPNFDPAVKAAAESAINEFNTKTCVKWVPKQPGDDSYAEISFDPNFYGCSGWVGPYGGKKTLILSSNCNTDRGLIMHEMMHIMGFLHEHSREDRDKYVRVNWQNIKAGMRGEFEKASVMYASLKPYDLGLPYDYHSLMHYKATVHSGHTHVVPAGFVILTVPDPVLEPLQPVAGEIGNGDTFTDLDIKKIAKYYECEGGVSKVPSREEWDAMKVAEVQKNPYFQEVGGGESGGEEGSDDGPTEVTGEYDDGTESDVPQNSEPDLEEAQDQPGPEPDPDDPKPTDPDSDTDPEALDDQGIIAAGDERNFGRPKDILLRARRKRFKQV